MLSLQLSKRMNLQASLNRLWNSRESRPSWAMRNRMKKSLNRKTLNIVITNDQGIGSNDVMEMFLLKLMN